MDRVWEIKLLLITDGRFSGATRGFCVGHVSPEAAVGGPIALIQNGDEIEIDAKKGSFSLMLRKIFWKKRRKKSKTKNVNLVQEHYGNFPKVLDLQDMELSRTQEPPKKKKTIQIFNL